ncbi:protein phosphatase 1G [Caerostris darwini]|uniref:protein-serine/threonine phosphatase n=1 Tax=Caerostris darwini TaxID=1538125 RepID=A0AAV4TKP0_9ARAC|nr:protein phosphatase 1G [Caerostris darwini]
MGNQMRFLSKPVTDIQFEDGVGRSFHYGAAAMQGWRKYQEDRFVCIPNFYEDCSFFGVYDGHGGSEVAEFLKQKLHFEILNSLQVQNDVELALHLGFLSCDASIMDPENIAELNDLLEEENRGTAFQILKHQKALEATTATHDDQSNVAGPSKKASTSENVKFSESATGMIVREFFKNMASSSHEEESSEQDTEEKMEIDKPIQYLLKDEIEPSDPEDEDFTIEDEEESSSTDSEEEVSNITAEEFFQSEPGYLSGSTATVAVIRESKVYVANVGDSRCVLSRNGKAIDMSVDHKPEDPDERSRILNAGGSVSKDGRVDGCLNLSRAFGDFKFKGNSFIPQQQSVTAEPYVNSIDIEKDDDFLIIASDGIWNAMTSQDAVDYINVRLQAGDCDLQDICEEMLKFTLAPNKDNDGTGCDNMCCIVVKFHNKDDDFSACKAGTSKLTTSHLVIPNKEIKI